MSPPWYLNEGMFANRQPRSAHYSVSPVLDLSDRGWLAVHHVHDPTSSGAILISAIGRTRPRLRSAVCYPRPRVMANRDVLTGIIDGELKRQSNAYWLGKLNGVLPRRPRARSGAGARQSVSARPPT